MTFKKATKGAFIAVANPVHYFEAENSALSKTIVFISRLRWLHLNRVERQVRTTIARHVRFGPLFVWRNPVRESKSPLKSTTSETSFPTSQIPYSGACASWEALCDAFEAGLFRSVEIATGLFTPIVHEEKRDQKMRYLIEMKLSSSVRSKVPQDGIFLIEQYILPSLEICRKWQADGKLLAGGPVSGAIQLAIVLEVESVQELDELIEGLPLWPLMDTSVIPLTTFEGRILAVQSKLKQLKSLIQDPASVIEAATRR